MDISQLPVGPAPAPVALPHFPDRLHTYVWRNWPLVALRRLAQVIGVKPEQILEIGRAIVDEARTLIASLEGTLRGVTELASRLHAGQGRDSCIGFEAACQYFYIGVGLAEKIVNCRDLLDRWIPEQRAKHGVT